MNTTRGKVKVKCARCMYCTLPMTVNKRLCPSPLQKNVKYHGRGSGRHLRKDWLVLPEKR